jgi:hypothetical protein
MLWYSNLEVDTSIYCPCWILLVVIQQFQLFFCVANIIISRRQQVSYRNVNARANVFGCVKVYPDSLFFKYTDPRGAYINYTQRINANYCKRQNESDIKTTRIRKDSEQFNLL